MRRPVGPAPKKWNMGRAFLGSIMGAFLGSVPLFFIEFRDQLMVLPLAALTGFLAVMGSRLLGARLKNFKVLGIIILGTILVNAVYQIFMNMLYVYESGQATTLGNLYQFTLVGPALITTLTQFSFRGVIILLSVIFMAYFLVDPDLMVQTSSRSRSRSR